MSHIGIFSSSGGGGSGTLTLNYTAVSTTPYVVSSTDEFLGVNTTTLAITIELPNAPATGRVYIVKDVTGLSPIHNITITTVGGAVDIDGATTYVMNSSFESVQLLFNGTEYLIF
ncbi:hypothetical protein UFOVP9_63 [uncultured Caudovirales phage]|jgi:hypothetical protein|uniref:Uncharacterized protein n=1 Tax=uncultured Caudovirales phage TaxID=2100421 RepID=A0A6J5KK60_9CAUD|nr:hypothetical protein UFOVP9_63 [uncultured Caudovirales phage]